MNHAAKKINSADVDEVVFDKSLDFLRGQIPVTQEEWEELEPKLRFRAFCVANQTKADYVYQVQQQLIDAVEKGKGISESWSDLKNLIDTDNIDPIRPGYWETVYRTNMNTIYTSGKLTEFEDTKPVAIQLFFINDDRQSHICHELFQETNGLALPADHPFWDRYGYPPYHFNCRTTFRGIYSSQVAKDVIVEEPPMKRFRKFKPQEGFGGNPVEKESWWQLTPSMIKRAEDFGIWKDVLQEAYDLDMKNYQKEILKGYKLDYTSKTGGYIKLATNWDEAKEPTDAKIEYDNARRLADNGHKVYMLPAGNLFKVKNPDMLIDNQIGEMKNPKTTSIANDIQRAGRAQHARIVYIKALPETTSDEIINGLYKGVIMTPVKEVILDWQNKIYNISRQTIKQKKWKP